MLSLIFTVVVLGVIYWIVSLLELPSPFPMVIKVLFVVLLVFTLLGAIGVHPVGQIGTGVNWSR